MNTSAGVRCKTDSLQRSPEEGTAFTDLERVQDQIRVAFRAQCGSQCSLILKPHLLQHLEKQRGQLRQTFIAGLISTSFTGVSLAPQYFLRLSTLYRSWSCTPEITLGGRWITFLRIRKLKGRHLSDLTCVTWLGRSEAKVLARHGWLKRGSVSMLLTSFLGSGHMFSAMINMPDDLPPLLLFFCIVF